MRPQRATNSKKLLEEIEQDNDERFFFQVEQSCENNRCESEARNFKNILLAMPNVGEDEDFSRIIDTGRNIELST